MATSAEILLDPTFIVALVAALAAAASAAISWRGLRQQARQAKDPPIVNMTCGRDAAGTLSLGLGMQNLGAVMWKATTIEVAHPRGARIVTLAEISRRYPVARPKLEEVDGLTNTCRIGVDIAPAGKSERYGPKDTHWSWVLVLVAHDSAIDLSIRLTFVSMEPRPRTKVVAIRRQLPAAASVET